jgi:hypothetical protein
MLFPESNTPSLKSTYTHVKLYIYLYFFLKKPEITVSVLNGKGKGKAVPLHAMKAPGGRGLLILNLGTRWR